MNRSNPFARAIAMMADVAVAMRSSTPQLALMKLGQYESHGKGKNRPSYSRGNPNRHSRTAETTPNGAAPCARRRRQIERGILTTSNGLTA